MQDKLWPITMTRKISDIHSGGFSMNEEKTLGFKKNSLFKTPKKLHELITFHKKNFKINLEKYKTKHILKGSDYIEIKDSVFVHKTATIDEYVTFNTQSGIIVIEKGVRIMPFSYLVGPIRIDEKAIIHSHSHISNSYIGKVSKIGGEIVNTIFESYSNKGHHGFLGDAYVGSWVNIGGGATVSNIKNTYSTIKMDGVETEEFCIGPIIADHVKIAINASIYTGKVIGVSSHIYGTVTENVPAFTNYISKNNQVTLPIKIAIDTAEAMQLRRNIKITKKDKKMLTEIFNITAKDRKKCDVKEGKLLF